MTASKMIRGTMILTVATFFAKFLGIFFVIPYNAMTGNEGTYLYTMSYTPYSIILSISTMGLPLAVSKFVSKYNALGDYDSGRRLFRTGIVLMSLTGLVGFMVVFFGSPWFVTLYNIPASNYANVVLVMRVCSIAILIVPVMSLMRGYFQGFQSMGPTAVSQVLEQVGRVGFILVSSFIIIKVMNGSVVTAAVFATFAAFIGAVAGLYVMLHYWVKRRPYIKKMEALQKDGQQRYKMRLGPMYKELISYAIPFVGVGIAMQLYQLLDQVMAFHYLEYSKQISTVIVTDLTMNDQKMVMIPVTLATSLAVSAVPAIIVSYTKGDLRGVNHKITEALQLVLFLTVPAAMGMSELGYMVHGLLYNVAPGDHLEIGGSILTWYSPSAIFFSLFQVGASILQGINHQRVTLVALGVGVLAKVLTNPISMKLFGMVGPIIATDLGYLISLVIILVAVRKATDYRFSLISSQFIHIIVYTAVMMLAIRLIFFFFGGAIPHSRWSALPVITISVIVGALIYLLLAKWTGLLRKIMGRTRSKAAKEN
ncbi:MAG: oligosaccharide flippase family protein [Sporolactobacillus sp.]